eukprot:TRINITY_DN2061_c0_g1_i1.p1 TRINITY_DN2061_c0_g1~~TRINITY_DN2061_c0_g1_i1.p1  ORF type:complete len:408 (-),score=37.16 TRINITY_DN2061_c0_g1_i1:993-2216(-)
MLLSWALARARSIVDALIVSLPMAGWPLSLASRSSSSDGCWPHVCHPHSSPNCGVEFHCKKAKIPSHLYGATTLTSFSAALFSLSLVKFEETRLRVFCRLYGLVPKVVHIDTETTISTWVPAAAFGVPTATSGKAFSQRKKTPLLLIHGFGGSAIWQWIGQLEALTAEYDVYMPDLVFFGGSTSTSSKRTEIFQAECLMKLMDILKVDRFDVVGISYGGLVSFRLATLYPTRVARLVITCSGVMMTPAELTAMLDSWGVKSAAELLLPATTAGVARLVTMAFGRVLPFPHFFYRDAYQSLFCDMVQEKKELLEAVVGRLDEAQPEPIPIPVQPMHLIWGELDGVFSVAIGRRMRDYFHASGTELTVIPGAYHMVSGCRPREYNRALLHFLRTTAFDNTATNGKNHQE